MSSGNKKEGHSFSKISIGEVTGEGQQETLERESTYEQDSAYDEEQYEEMDSGYEIEPEPEIDPEVEARVRARMKADYERRVRAEMQAEAQARARAEHEQDSEDEEPDYSVDDLPPLSRTQIIVMFLAVVGVIFALFQLFTFYSG